MMMKFFIFLFCGTEVAALKSIHTDEKRVESGDGAPTIFGVVGDKFHQESSRVFRKNLNCPKSILKNSFEILKNRSNLNLRHCKALMLVRNALTLGTIRQRSS